MPTAFVLINSEIGFESDVLNELEGMRGVDQTFAVYGVYDLIAKVRADTMDKLRNMVHQKIRKLDKVKSTLTMIVMEER